MHIVKLGRCVRHCAHNAGDQRSAAIGVQIHLISIGANFGHSGQALQALHQLRRTPADAQLQQISPRNRRLQFRRRALCDYVPVIDDGNVAA